MSTIFPLPLESAIDALSAAESLTMKVSLRSLRLSALMGTEMRCTVSPGANVSVPRLAA